MTPVDLSMKPLYGEEPSYANAPTVPQTKGSQRKDKHDKKKQQSTSALSQPVTPTMEVTTPAPTSEPAPVADSDDSQNNATLAFVNAVSDLFDHIPDLANAAASVRGDLDAILPVRPQFQALIIGAIAGLAAYMQKGRQA